MPSPCLRALCVLISVASVTACGQKGSPLAPIVYLPRPVTDLTARRMDNEVVLQFTLPTLNTDSSGPADLRRVEVYAHTGPLPAAADFLKYGTRIASIDVKDPKEQRTEGREPTEASQESKPDGPAPEPGSATPEAQIQNGQVEQGWAISVRETLTDKHRETGPMPPTRPAPAPPPGAPVIVIERLETPGTSNFELPPMRYYTIVGLSQSRGRRGPFAGPLRVPLGEPAKPPEGVNATYTESAISLTWLRLPEDRDVAPAADAPPPVAADLLDRETEGTVELYSDVETDGTVDASAVAVATPVPRKPPAAPAPRFGYNVYDAGATGATSATGATNADGARVAAPIRPLNTAMLTAPGFTDPRVEFGTERCYVVRRVEMNSGIAIESPPTPPICVMPVDTFPPAAPKSLAHIASGSGVSLLWDPNTESDLAGYLVLRGEAPDDKLSPLTPTPITETSFNDTTVRRGRTYIYEIVAVDRQTPPNVSAPSNRVEETIR